MTIAAPPDLGYEACEALMALDVHQHPEPWVHLPPWMDYARCADADPEVFFPGSPRNPATEARAICRTCRVRVECLDLALREGLDVGVFGGVREADRRKVSLLG